MNPKIVVIAHNIRSCHNVGSLLRTADGIGVEKLLLTGYTPYPIQKNDKRLPHLSQKIEKQIDKTALGAQKTQPWEYAENLQQIIKKLLIEGYVICALEQDAKSIPINKFKAPDNIALLLGNEVEGLEQSVLEKADHILEIPMYGRKESYNVVQAASMALYSFRFNGK